MKDDNVKKIIADGILFVFGVFLLALCYNLLLQPNGFAFAGMSGIAIVVEKITGLSSTTFIYVSHIVCLIISFIFLGWNKTKNTIVGSILYPVMLSITTPITDSLMPYFQFDDMFLTAICTALLFGVSNGLIYRCGFTTGGNDVLMQLLNKYLKIPEAKGLLVINGIVIVFCVFLFGFAHGIYSLIISIASSMIIDKIMYGISDSKIFYIFTKKPAKLKKIIFEEYGSGYTILPTRGGYSHKNGYLIMVVIGNRDYYSFKNKIIEIDPNAFFVIEDSYEVRGGVKRANLPFM